MEGKQRIVGLFGAVLFAVNGLLGSETQQSAWPVPEMVMPGLKLLIETAVKQSPRMMARSTDEAISAANLMAVRAGQLPSVSGYYNYNPWLREQREGESLVRYSARSTYAFSVSQPLFHWNALKYNTRIGMLQQEISEAQTAEAYRMLVNEVRAQFLQLALKKASLGRALFGLRQAKVALELTEERVKRNTAAPADLFNPRMAVQQSALLVERLQEDYDSSRLLLGKLCGAPAVPDDQIPGAVPMLPLELSDLQQLVGKAVEAEKVRSFSLDVVDDQIESEKLTYLISKVRLRPKINVGAGISQDQQSYSANIGDKYGVAALSVGVSITWSVFDGFATKASKLASLARRRQLERNRQELSADLREQARSKARQLEFSVRSLELTHTLLQIAEANVNNKRGEVERGLASEADLRATEYALAGAQIETYSARYDYIMKLCDLLSFLHLDPALQNLPVSYR